MKSRAWYHGSKQDIDIFSGAEYFTDSPAEATAYAEMKALRELVDTNDELGEIVADIMAEEGAEDFTDLNVPTIHDIIEGNDIEIEGEIGKGSVNEVTLRYDNPLDLINMGSSLGSEKYVGKTWDELYKKGLLKEGPFDSFDPDVQDEIKCEYADKALYTILDRENIYKQAFDKGYDAVIFMDQGLGGETTHRTALVKAADQIQKARPVKLLVNVPLVVED